MMCRAYTLAQNGHVRGDFLCVNMKPRTQAWFDRSCISCFSSRHCGADLCRLLYAADSWRIAEHSNVTADGRPSASSSGHRLRVLVMFRLRGNRALSSASAPANGPTVARPEIDVVR
jgi:hypothetical protein